MNFESKATEMHINFDFFYNYIAQILTPLNEKEKNNQKGRENEQKNRNC